MLNMLTPKRIVLTGAVLATFAFAVGGLAASSHAADAATKPAAPTTQPDQGGPLKFYGVISAVDVQAKTFTVDNQTYTVIGETHMTKAADDSPATLADAVVGEPARGTYTRTDDGKLNVTKVRFGKKAGGKAGGGGKSGGKKKKDAATQADGQ